MSLIAPKPICVAWLSLRVVKSLILKWIRLPPVPSMVIQISALHWIGFKKIKFISKHFPFHFSFFLFYSILHFLPCKTSRCVRWNLCISDMDFMLSYLIKELSIHQMIFFLYSSVGYAVSIWASPSCAAHMYDCAHFCSAGFSFLFRFYKMASVYGISYLRVYFLFLFPSLACFFCVD